jgi:hypothetical protein
MLEVLVYLGLLISHDWPSSLLGILWRLLLCGILTWVAIVALRHPHLGGDVACDDCEGVYATAVAFFAWVVGRGRIHYPVSWSNLQHAKKMNDI